MDRVKLRRGLQVSQWIFLLDKELLEAISKTADRCANSVTLRRDPVSVSWLVNKNDTKKTLPPTATLLLLPTPLPKISYEIYRWGWTTAQKMNQKSYELLLKEGT